MFWKEKEEAARIICNSRENFWNGYLNFWKLFKSVIEKMHLSHLARDKRVGTRPVTGPEHAGMKLRQQRATPATQQQRQRRTSVSRLQMARHFVHPWIICGAMPNANTSAASLPICMCATCASHAHPATICTCIAKTARTYWCPQPPSPNVIFTREISSEIETKRLRAFFIKARLIWSYRIFVVLCIFLHLSILIEGTDPFELMISYWFDLTHTYQIIEYLWSSIHNKTGELIIQTNWGTNVLKWICSLYNWLGRIKFREYITK